MKLHHTKYKENYKNYILGTIETGLNDEPLTTDQEKIKYIFDRFSSEYGFMIVRVGKLKAVSEWLSGLALDLPYYMMILKLAIKLGSIDPNPSQKLIEKVENNYWDFMAILF